ncbi:hypothetical protein [Microbacterium rhizosphaerae]|uniref:DUF4145 domain-containing protein n=1 Tax=Microbacterium rhizosphaerae TaxID=1678237 RepID=A0ABZ0SSV4_9MICO|nr:hypothetical protein [Microbacterium rhizosphaerae]WPR91339.1 hypothetical protein SM116_08705 [Microbacterium rhizosphaerae]
MLLSDLLSKAPEQVESRVDRFLFGSRPLGWGKTTTLKSGQVALNFQCRTCGGIRTFLSGSRLSCLVVGAGLLSIDVTLKCSTCANTVEAWFLVAAVDDFYSSAPLVRVERYTENLRDRADRVESTSGPFSDLLTRAQLAYELGLGAGSMIYLRKIFELVTHEVAEIAEVPIVSAKGKRRPFKDVLQEVNEKRNIIPLSFSGSGYKLFGELSDVIHGQSDEVVALAKYAPCRQLVLGVVDQVNKDNEFAKAIEELGWDVDDIGRIAAEGAMS